MPLEPNPNHFVEDIRNVKYCWYCFNFVEFYCIFVIKITTEKVNNKYDSNVRFLYTNITVKNRFNK